MKIANKKVLEAIGRSLLKNRESIAVAESVTSGLLQFAFSTVPDAACFFQGGLTAYNLAQKFKHLQVEPLHAQAVNCVSQKVADDMARHVCMLYCSDWGVGVTGYATPVPESGNKLFAFYTIIYKGKRKSHGRIPAPKAEPTNIQLNYVSVILRKLAAVI